MCFVILSVLFVYAFVEKQYCVFFTIDQVVSVYAFVEKQYFNFNLLKKTHTKFG